MRITLAATLCLISLTCLAQVQETPQKNSQPSSQDGGVHEVLESIVVSPIPHAPFYATLATEWVKYSADGSTMTFVNERQIARDSLGRVYEERWFLVPKNGSVKSQMNWIQVLDPKQHTLYNCSPFKHMCDLLVYNPTGDLAAATLHKGSSGALPDGQGTVAWEELGTRNIAGVETVGVRQTTITNPGAMGNDLPLTSISEYWHSEQLGINLLSIRSSPFFGKQTFTVTDLTPGDPNPQLFELPAGYKVTDQRKNPPISY